MTATAIADVTVKVNGPEGGVFDWDAIDWRQTEGDVRRLRQRIVAMRRGEGGGPAGSRSKGPGSTVFIRAVSERGGAGSSPEGERDDWSCPENQTGCRDCGDVGCWRHTRPGGGLRPETAASNLIRRQLPLVPVPQAHELASGPGPLWCHGLPHLDGHDGFVSSISDC